MARCLTVCRRQITGEFDRYERTGNAGSSLLQTREAITVATECLAQKMIADNVRYLEVRCSPCNYTRGGLSALDVVKTIHAALEKHKDKLSFGLIIIGSRHRKMSDIYQHIELVEEINQSGCDYNIVGFDLAGAENKRSAAELQVPFLSLMRICQRITVHAGETDDAESIWQAVHYLNAERIGHGLTLAEKPELLQRIVDRRIALEMCPSSNVQIVGYRDWQIPQTSNLPEYPIKQYLDKGVRVTVNTDNPGLSRCMPSDELYRAGCLVKVDC